MEGILLLVIVFAVMMIPMLLMSNRQRKMQRQQQEMVAQLGVGDEVRTHSGFYGLIVEEYDEFVILETESGAQTKWARAAIATKVDAEGRPVAHGAASATPDDHADTAHTRSDGDVATDRGAHEARESTDESASLPSDESESSARRATDDDVLGGSRADESR